MQAENPEKGIRVIILLSLVVFFIGLFQGTLKTYWLPAFSSLALLLMFEKLWYPNLCRNCLRTLEKLLEVSDENSRILSTGDMEGKSYYIAINDPRTIQLIQIVLQTKNIQLLFNPRFVVRLQQMINFLLFATVVLLFVIIFTKNSLLIWVVYLIWLIPTLMMGSQVMRRKKMSRLLLIQMQYARKNKLSRVAFMAKRVGRITKREFGKNSLDYALSMHNLGGIYKIINDYRNAELAFEKSYSIWKKTNLKEELFYIQSLYELASIYFNNSKFDKAEKHFLELLQLVENDDKFYIEILKELSLLKLIQENIPKVKEYNNQIKSRILTVYGKDSDEYLFFLHFTQFLDMKQGNLRDAETYHDKDLEKTIRSNLKNEPLAKYLQSQGVYYLSANNNDKAEEYFNEALTIRLEYWGENHPAVAEIKKNISYLLRAKGEKDMGEAFIREALKINENCYGEFNDHVAGCYSELGHCLVEKGEYEEAEQCIKKAMEIYEKIFSKSHPIYQNTRFILGWLYDEKGDTKKAETIIWDVYNKTLKFLGNEHPILRIDRYQIASFKARSGKYKEALEFYKLTKATDDKLIRDSFFLVGEQQKLKLMDGIFTDIDKVFSLVTRHLTDDADAVSFMMDLILQRKGLVVDILTSRNKTLTADSNATLQDSLNELTNIKREVAQLELEGYETLSTSEYRERLKSYNKRKVELEENASRHISLDQYSGIFNDQIRKLIASKLKSNEVLVEFIKFNSFNFNEKKDDSTEYFAFLLFSNRPDKIKCIKLGNADSIESITKEVLSKITSKENRERSDSDLIIELLTNLSTKLLQPIIDGIDQCDRLYLVPDGELHRIPFEAMLTKDGNYAVENYHIRYLNSGRDLLSETNRLNEVPFSNSAIIANPDYNLGEKPDKKYYFTEHSRLGLGFVDELPWTQTEADNLGKILNVKPIIQKKATRKYALELSSPEFLHFATHGFFMPIKKDIENFNAAIMGAENLANNQLSTIQNPMLRSGLVLAGFNAWFSYKDVPKEMGNGLLTALDISMMKLSGTKLVVLSACESGLGDIDNGEGVFGLRRAFKIAGAKSMVMSLWSVKDKETQQLMTDFYTNLNKDNNNIYEAFRNAQLKFINNNSRNPFIWGAFIFVGIGN